MHFRKYNLGRNLLTILCFIFLLSFQTFAQLTVTPNQTAAVLASSLAGTGVTVLNPTLTCAGVANGTFASVGTLLNMSNGIILTNGHSAACVGPNGAPPGVASFTDGTAGDPALAIYLPAGTATHDACILEFDVVAAGDSIGFNYQFGSQEYYHSTCGQYPDIFAFFISGPGIVGAPNIALVPGTNIPVEINSVNAGSPGGPGGLGPGVNISNCTSLGAGSPFTAYFINNWGGSQLSYTGFTTKLRAAHVVTACDTYHLKLSIADADNSIYDSGVFLEASSLTPPTIATPPAICVGGTVGLTAPTTGGTWTSAYTTVATIGFTTGIVTGVSGGTATISYLVGPTCAVTTIVTVNAPAPISGTPSVCTGGTTILTDIAGGGTWSSSNTVVATIGAASGIVNGLTVGTTTISYVTAGGCSASIVVTVSSVLPVTGTLTVCEGLTTALTDVTTGGIWSSSNTAIATISGTGIVTGVGGGTANITYSLGTGCYADVTVTVIAIAPIVGPVTVCVGNTITLSDAATGGTWSSSNVVVATIGMTTGILTGATSGTTTITYTTAGTCTATKVVTVNFAGEIAGPTNLCIGTTGTLTDIVTGGAWSSSNAAVLTISGSGLVTAIAGGTATISYTVPGGCFADIVVTVGTFTSNTVNASICQGSSYLFAGATYTTTGTYTHTFTTATCDSIVTLDLIVNTATGSNTPVTICGGTSYAFGGLTYNTTGTYTFTTTNAHGCDSTAILNLVVNPIPPMPTVLSPVSYCIGAPTMPLVATGTGTIYWLAPGSSIPTTTIPPVSDGTSGTTTYYVWQVVNGCPGPRDSIQVFVSPKPVASITAIRNALCQYDTTSLFAGTVPSGTYSWYAPGNTIVSNSENNQDVVMQFNSLGDHEIYLTVTEDGGLCSAIDSINIIAIPSPISTFYVKPNICLGDTVVVAISSTTAGVTNCTWNFEDATIITATDQVWGGPYKVTWNNTGIHYIQMSAEIGQCVSKLVIDTVDVHALPDAQFNDLTTGDICMGDSALLSAVVKDPANQYEWLPTHFFKNTNSAEIYGIIERAGYVTLDVTTPFGCKASDSILINAQSCCDLLLPNAFTPNGDNHDDIFHVLTVGHHMLHMFMIKNRFGQTVFQTSNQEDGWDGNFNGVPQDIGVYYYYFRYDCNGKTVEQKGDVTLIR